MLEIKNLHVKLAEEDKQILKGVDLTIESGKVHAIMGPNGSGKSTLSYVLSGRDGYVVTEGSATMDGVDLLGMEVEERAAAGLFLAFQYPVEIPGVGNMTFLRTAMNAQRKARGEEELASADFLKLVRAKAKALKIDAEMLKRPVNVGFSGGEKKRNEILQMAMLEPKMCILDETDSGLDVDAMKLVAEGVNALRSPERSFVVITHYQRLLDHIQPDVVHIMAAGRIIKTGGPELALEVEQNGYADILAEVRLTCLAGAKRNLQPKFDAVEARIAGLSLPKGGVWASEARKAALARLSAMGMPHGRDEYWRFTRPDTLVQPDAVPASVFEHHELQIFAKIDRLHLVFCDGKLDLAGSDPLALAAVEIQPLAEAAAADIHWAREVYGVLEAKGQDPVDRPLAALNTAFATEGLAIRVTGKAAKPIHLTYLQSGPETDVMMHHVIRLEPGADLTLLENGPAAARFTKVMEVDVADGAAFHHIRTQGRAHERRAATHIFARLGAESTFKSFTLTANGALTRNEVVVELTGDDAVAHIAGAALGDGKSGAFHHDDTVFVTHDAENCESRQVFKKVLRNGATGVFQGKILVKPGAQKTDGYQISQALMLDEDSQFLAKPELEIYADDVACSHGSTSGALDETALFYLRSRGVPTEIATDLLIVAFVAEAIDEIEDPAIAEVIRQRLESWLARRRG